METIDVSGKEVKYVVDPAGQDSDKGIVFIPGVSGGALGDRWKSLADAANSRGYDFLRFDSWADEEELKQKSMSGLHEEISALVKILKERGKRKIALIGKSFGGAAALMLDKDDVDAMVLWAPVIGTDENDNVAEMSQKRLGDIPQLTDIKLSSDFLSKNDSPVLIIHGTSDEVIPFENSSTISGLAGNIEVFSIESAGHSFKDEESKKLLFDKTLEFFDEKM